MTRIRVEHSIGDLASDLASIPVTVTTKSVAAVARNVDQGTKLAQKFARASSGPHGRFYWKRISGEASGLSGEYGPTGDVVGNAVGAGWRNGPPNTDLPKSADIQGPKFADDIGDILDKAFWP